MKMEEKLFSIEEVSRQVKIPKHTLRFWEKEFEGLLAPSRTDGRQRRYAPSDIATIEVIKRMRSRGINLWGIKKALSLENGRRQGIPEVELFANKMAELVKTEVCRFLEDGEEAKKGPWKDTEAV